MKRRAREPLSISPPSFKAARKEISVAGITVEDRLEVFNVVQAILARETSERDCPAIGDSPDDRIYAIAKISGDSAFGQVFKVGFAGRPGAFVAVKLLPHLNVQTEGINANEIANARRASDLVRWLRSPYFPLVYGSGACPNLELAPPTDGDREMNPKSVLLYTRANNWKIIRYLIEAYVSPENRDAFAKQVVMWDAYSVVAFIKEGANITDPMLVDIAAPVSGDLIFMELAWGDLNNFIDVLSGIAPGPDLKQEDMEFVIRHVFEAIVHLQMELILVHGDLHLGNVLIQFIRDEETGSLRPWPLITDFGHSRSILVDTPRDSVQDVSFFIDFLNQRAAALPEPIRTKVRELHRALSLSRRGPKTIDEVKTWWLIHSSVPVSISSDASDSKWSRFLA